MAELHNSVTIDAAPDAVWAVVGDLEAVGLWIPMIATAKLDGGKRVCTTADGGEIREDIHDYSEETRSYRYTVTQAPLPVEVVRGTISVSGGDADQSVVNWDVDFKPLESADEREVGEMLDGVYKASLQTLRERVEGAFVSEAPGA